MSSKNRLATVFTEAHTSRVIFTQPGDLIAHLVGRMRDREILTRFEQVIRVVPGKGDEARATGERFEYASCTLAGRDYTAVVFRAASHADKAI